MPDFIQEVRQEVRQQRYADLFNRYKFHLLALAIFAVVGTAGANWYHDHRVAKEAASGDIYREAMDFVAKENPDSALPRLNGLVEKGNGGYKYLAMLQRAKILTDKAQYDDAKLAYDVLIADAGADVVFRDYAVVASSWLLIEHGKPEEQENAKRRLEAMTGPGKPWSATAQELLALQALKLGKKDEARTLLTEIGKSPLSPTELKKRDGEILTALGGPLPSAALPAAKKDTATPQNPEHQNPATPEKK